MNETPTLTPKMKNIADEIGNSIFRYYDRDTSEAIFCGPIVVEDVIFQVLIECCRYAYLMNTEKHPLKYYIERDNLELEVSRKILKRTIEYVDSKYDTQQIVLKDYLNVDIVRPQDELSSEPGKYPQYNIDEFYYWELNNIHQMGLVKAILEKRIPFSKKVSNNVFISLAEEYDRMVSELITRSSGDAEDIVFSSLALFTLEGAYAFDYYYKIARALETGKEKEFEDLFERLSVVTGVYKTESVLLKKNPEMVHPDDCFIYYPMIVQRERIINLITNPSDSVAIDSALGALREANVLANAIQSHIRLEGQIMRKWFVENTVLSDWASVFKVYNIYRVFDNNKEWSDRRISIIRKIYKELSIDYKAYGDA